MFAMWQMLIDRWPIFYIGRWHRTGADAVEPLFHVILRLPERDVISPFLDFFGRREVLHHARRVRAEVVADDFDATLAADEYGSAAQIARWHSSCTTTPFL
jgi:hypothetical protein